MMNIIYGKNVRSVLMKLYETLLKGLRMTIAEQINDEINKLVLLQYPDKGNFYASGIIESSNLSMRIDNEEYRIPLLHCDLELLKSKCQPAVFGKGTETVYDDNVRKCLQLKKDEIGNIEIINNQTYSVEGIDHYLKPTSTSYPRTFNGILDDITYDIRAKINISTISLEFHDLVIYEKGSFFKEHTDTEKQENMIGTLVISLPGYHTGGMMKVKHADREECFISDLDSTMISWCAFYADCKHEVFPVRDGTRITLVYNIILYSDKKIGDDIIENQELNQLVKNYFDETEKRTFRYEMEEKIEEPYDIMDYGLSGTYKEKEEIINKNDNLIFTLEHYYSEHGFKYTLLKNRDRYIVDLLYAVAVSNNLDFKLGLADIEENWEAYCGPGNNIWDDSKEHALINQKTQLMEGCDFSYAKYTLSLLMDSITNIIEKDIDLTCNDVFSLNDTFLYDAEAQGESVQGNWGGDITRQYKRAVVVLRRK